MIGRVSLWLILPVLSAHYCRNSHSADDSFTIDKPLVQTFKFGSLQTLFLLSGILSINNTVSLFFCCPRPSEPCTPDAKTPPGPSVGTSNHKPALLFVTAFDFLKGQRHGVHTYCIPFPYGPAEIHFQPTLRSCENMSVSCGR